MERSNRSVTADFDGARATSTRDLANEIRGLARFVLVLSLGMASAGCGILEALEESAGSEDGIEESDTGSGGSDPVSEARAGGGEPSSRRSAREPQVPVHQQQSRLLMSPAGELGSLFETTRRPIETATETPEGPALKRMSRRNVILWPLVTAGRVGHDTKGYLVVRDEKALGETLTLDGRSATVEQVLASENADRKLVVKIVAEARDGAGVDLEGYEQAAFEAWNKWIEPGHWIFVGDGNWVQVD